MNDRVAELEKQVRLLEASVNYLMKSSETAAQHQPSETTFAQATPQTVSSQHDKIWGAEEDPGLYSANIGQVDSILGDHSLLQFMQPWQPTFPRS